MNQEKLSSLLIKVIDNRGKTPPLTQEGHCLIEIPAIDGISTYPNYSKISKYVSEEIYRTWFRKGHPKKGDTLIGTVGGIGRVAIMKENKGCIAQNIVGLRADPKFLDPYYLFYFLSWNKTQQYLKKIDIGAAQPSIKVPHLLAIDIALPNISSQNRIGQILSAYDDLIQNNTRQIQILEEMAQRIYKEWFVDFRFPGHEKVKFVDSELGRIPSGWGVKKLSDVAYVNVQTITGKNGPEHIHYIDIQSVSPGRVNEAKDLAFSEAPSRARRKVQSKDILWSTVRPNRKSYALILDPEPNTIASTGFAVITPHRLPYTYLYGFLSTDSFVEYLTNHATGSAYPAVNQNDFKNAKIVVPDQPPTVAFHELADPMYYQAHYLMKKNNNLRQTRDLLLPKLISGEIDVSEMPDPKEAAAA